MSYVHANELFENFMTPLRNCEDAKNPAIARKAMLEAIERQSDPRFKECMGRIFNEIYGKYFPIEEIDLKSLWS